MEFPDGNMIKKWEKEGIANIIEELEREDFTGVLKVKVPQANLLFLGGEVVAATTPEGGGEEAWETLLSEGLVEAEAHELVGEKARFLLLWYTDVCGYERLSREVAREEVLKRVGLFDPDRKKLEEILKSEGMEHLARKEEEDEPVK